MTSNNLTPIINSITALLSTAAGRPILIALDGRCGSGKTTLAAQLAEPFPGSAVFHTDDYYLPPAQRIPNWAETPCANMDLTRLREEVLVPTQAGAAVHCRVYSCREGVYLPEQCVPPAPLYILEGSYSHHPILAGFYDLKVFVTCSKEEQARRLQAREGERYENFVRRWIPLEEVYFAQCRIEALADLLWDTTNL